MLFNAGKIAILNAIANGKSKIFAVAIGDGGADPVTGIAIAPSPDQTALNAQVFYEEGVDSVKVVVPVGSIKPVLEVRHTFSTAGIPLIGRAVTTANEFGVFMNDPNGGAPILVWGKTFELKAGEKFRMPASGKVVTPDSIVITEDIPIS